MDKLLPCPFCGSDQVKVRKTSASWGMQEYYAQCQECLSLNGTSLSEEKAGTIWNTRTPQAPDELLEALEFYADEDNWLVLEGNVIPAIIKDFGKKAKQALSKYQKPKDKE